MENKNLGIKVQQRRNKKTIIAFSVVIAILLILNIILISVAFFSDRGSGESIVTFGSISVDSYVMESGQKKTSISLDSNELIAGATTTKDLHIDVTGKNDCFVRLKGEFQISFDNGITYESASEFIGFSIDTEENTNWQLYNGKYYYNSLLQGTETSGGASKINVDVTFTVDKNFGNSNDDNTSIYKNKPYKIVITIETCQAEGSSLIVGNVFHPENWISD